MPKPPPRGRRRGKPGTKDAILRAARSCFGERGYAATTMRRIAAVAGVDQALIAHYFESKRRLFADVLGEEGAAHERLGPISDSLPLWGVDAGERIVIAFLERWDNETGPSTLGTLLRAAGSDDTAERLLGVTVVRSMLTPAMGALSARVDSPRLRVALIAAQLLGLAWLRYVERREPLASASPRLLARTYGPSLTAALTGPRPERE